MRTGVTQHNHSPPYITALSEVRHLEINTLRGHCPILLLYTDGVDNIVMGRGLFCQENPCSHDPAAMMGALLGDCIDERFMRDVFDHEVELKWLGQGGN